MSRTPVREALKQLQTEGLVEIRPRVGTFVTAPSRREITELFEMKELLEGAAARLLAHRGNVPELDLLRENLEQADAAVARDDRARYAELVAGVPRPPDPGRGQHQARGALPDADEPAGVLAARQHLSRQPGRALQSDQEHHRVLELVVAKDGDSAERVMREHVRASRRALLAGLDAQPGPPSTSRSAP